MPTRTARCPSSFGYWRRMGRLFILINLYKDNHYSLQWVDKLKVPVHVRSAQNMSNC